MINFDEISDDTCLAVNFGDESGEVALYANDASSCDSFYPGVAITDPLTTSNYARHVYEEAGMYTVTVNAHHDLWPLETSYRSIRNDIPFSFSIDYLEVVYMSNFIR